MTVTRFYLSHVFTETFKCGQIVAKKTRTIFRYERKNVTAENTTDANSTGLDSNFTEMPSTGNIAHLGIDPRDIVEEEEINAEMASMTRIVNGENCPPGECPWQVRPVQNSGGYSDVS